MSDHETSAYYDAETATTRGRAQTYGMVLHHSAARGEVPFWAGDPL